MRDLTSNGARNCFYESHKIDDVAKSTKEVIEEMAQIAQEIKGMTQEVAIMNKNNYQFMRILVVVVCIIALGRVALDVADLFITKVVAESASTN